MYIRDMSIGDQLEGACGEAFFLLQDAYSEKKNDISRETVFEYGLV